MVFVTFHCCTVCNKYVKTRVQNGLVIGPQDILRWHVFIGHSYATSTWNYNGLKKTIGVGFFIFFNSESDLKKTLLLINTLLIHIIWYVMPSFLFISTNHTSLTVLISYLLLLDTLPSLLRVLFLSVFKFFSCCNDPISSQSSVIFFIQSLVSIPLHAVLRPSAKVHEQTVFCEFVCEISSDNPELGLARGGRFSPRVS